ncbi:lipase family protein [Pseudomonas sp. BP8]|uniref:lipase family protein n=1 Tax=Pseudomonas sp. BP8 TaxID=2817864 RepID=UPI001AE99D6B|nr:lipase family protein [Pseudomonas sp. BP8]MBP2264437.1 hypothetical protein [Pseudomonas sp. BP8]HDS1738019.1 lipase family protein [Pseudomonas putida]
MTYEPLAKVDKASFGGRIHACPLRDHSSSFQLVDEFGDGKPYAGLTYEITDYEGVVYSGQLDSAGSGKVQGHHCGPVLLRLIKLYQGTEKFYQDSIRRPHYPLPITELQVRAEKTRFFNDTGVRTRLNPAQDKADVFLQVEVSELVEHIAHLPPRVDRNFPPNKYVHALFRKPPQPKTSTTQNNRAPGAGMNTVVTPTDLAIAELGFAPPPPTATGIALLPNKHHVLEVRPLRALRPMLSTSNEFCALNLYQLALMATLSYTDFGQNPNVQPVETDDVSFPTQPSSGNWFGHALPQFDELWQVEASQAHGKAYYPLYEEVPYSRRLEVVPFDPVLYPGANDPLLGDAQENPAKLHFLDDRKRADSTDTQAFITHHENLILISVRGTSEVVQDGLRDADARQVPFEEGVGKVHNGFYGAAKVARTFVADYLEKFHSGQKLVITGHSLGGAIALILAEMLRRDERFDADIVLYTYGAPRAADKTFVEGASDLVHHRIVNHNDPVPSVPATWMNTSEPKHLAARGAVTLLSAPAGLALLITGVVNFAGEPYAHHGSLRHFMPVNFGAGEKSSILWAPGCSTILDHGCARVLRETDGLPVRGSILRQLLDNADHKMVASYIPNCWASLRRWQESRAFNRSLVTEREFAWVDNALKSITHQLRDLTRSLRARPDMYVQSQQATTLRLHNEIEQLHMTRARLGLLRGKRVTEGDIYGVFAGQPELLEESLPRWNAHVENLAPEQLAMIPPAADDDERAIAAITGGHVVGAPFHLDIDSII